MKVIGDGNNKFYASYCIHGVYSAVTVIQCGASGIVLTL